MKNIKYLIYALFTAVILTACTDKYEYDGVGEAESETAAGVFFASSNPTTTIEVEPGAEAFDVTFQRTDATEEVTVALEVLSDEAGVFEVPSSVTFAAGATTAKITVTAPNAEEGKEYALTIGIADDQKSIYGAGLQTRSFSMAVLVWEDLGTGYLQDGIVAGLFGYNHALLSTKVKKLDLGGGAYRFRIISPYTSYATAQDNLGAYNGLPYTALKNNGWPVSGVETLINIDVDAEGNASMPYLRIGFHTFIVGTWDGFGYPDDPLGVYDEEAGTISFPAGTLGVYYGQFYNAGETVLYLSADAYLASLDDEEEGE